MFGLLKGLFTAPTYTKKVCRIQLRCDVLHTTDDRLHASCNLHIPQRNAYSDGFHKRRKRGCHQRDRQGDSLTDTTGRRT